MLFSSIEFVFCFLPLTLAGFVLLRARAGIVAAQLWLVGASLVFYGWWDIRYVPLLLASIAFNFAFGRLLGDRGRGPVGRRVLLGLGVGFNVGLIGIFKYLHFFANTALWAAGAQTRMLAFALPLGISFFTFQQIAYLVEVHRGRYQPARPLIYVLFITFFPHLIAGPIVHYVDLAPQFLRQRRDEPVAGNLAVGLTIFVVGLFKKLALADAIGPRIDEIYAAVALGAAPGLVESWVLALAYSMQLYFDFSGYSDMAIGIARMFGVVLSVNFLSPYKAQNITEFWRRWHITLSNFLRDFLYIPLGGNRRGLVRQCANLMLTMLIGGLWHGAGWTFVLWGGLHGGFLVANHLWRRQLPDFAGRAGPAGVAARVGGRVVTFLCVMAAFVVFRAATLDAALGVLGGMLGRNGLALPSARQLGPLGPALAAFGVELAGTPYLLRAEEMAVLLLMCAIAWFAPNIYEVMAAHTPALRLPVALDRPRLLAWRPALPWALGTALLAGVAFFRINSSQVFLYYTF